MHIGMICPEGTGHLNPQTTVGSELQRRGNQVTLIGARQTERLAHLRELGYASLGIESGRADHIDNGFRDLGTLSGLASMRQTGRVLAESASMILEDLPHVIETLQFDGLVIDQLTPAAVLVAERYQVPFVVACNALAMIYDPYLPPPPLPWRYRCDLIGRVRNEVAKRILMPLYERVAGANKTGVRPFHLVFEPDFGLAMISQQPAFFDFPNPSRPDHFHFTAPWHVSSRDAAMDFPWQRLDHRPLVYASMGTLQNNQQHIFAAICAAVRELPLQMVLTQGGAQASFQLDVPDNVILVNHAPQLKLLDRATVAITHAGLNTVLECLQRGVPMVCLPVTNDQPGVAVRVEWLGLGEMLPTGRVSAARLRSLIESVLGDDSYRNRARELQSEVRDLSGPQMAADIIERAFQTGERVLSADMQQVWSDAVN